MNLVVFEAEQWEAAAFGILRAEFDLNCTADSLAESNAAKFRDAEIITVFVNSNLTASVLVQLPNLKFIATRSTGFDHIDLDYCARSGIAVATVPDYGDVTVAEHVFALLLSLARHLTAYREQAAYADFARANLRGFELHGKIMGVIGTGRIGRRVIQIARGFGMQVIAYDVTSRDAIARALGFRYVDFHQLLSEPMLFRFISLRRRPRQASSEMPNSR
jgi:D-lactate dehydrogenase